LTSLHHQAYRAQHNQAEPTTGVKIGTAVSMEVGFTSVALPNLDRKL
jgi:hypothetical protein